MFCEHAWIQTSKLTAVPVCGVHHTGCDQWLSHYERRESCVCVCARAHARVCARTHARVHPHAHFHMHCHLFQSLVIEALSVQIKLNYAKMEDEYSQVQWGKLCA
jgi:hypothetical protein